MKVKCRLCGELVEEEQLKAHATAVGSSCRAALFTMKLLREGYRPFPTTNTLPRWINEVYEVAKTRGKYDGEPREQQGFLAVPEEQLWVPHWIDVIAELWAGPIYIEGAVKQAQRDECIDTVKIQFTSSMKYGISEARREDLRAAREYLKKWNAFKGDPPMLISEFEALGRFADPRYRT